MSTQRVQLSQRWICSIVLCLVSAPLQLRAAAGDCEVSPSPFWKNSIVFPDDPFRVDGGAFGEPGWVKFTILTCDPATVYHQDGQQYEFHYEFATQVLDPFLGLTLQQFNAVTLFEANRQAVLGAVVLPPMIGFPQQPVANEYGIQLVGQDPFDPQEVVDYFNTVKATVTADPGVQAFYFPTFEQLQTALDNADFLAANNITISSPARWASGNSCYSKGWALGDLKFFPAANIEDAFLAGNLQPDDILLTDGVPASIPLVAGIISLAPSTPNSHIAILANTFQVPFVHLALAADVAEAQSLVGRRVVVRAGDNPLLFGAPVCSVSVIDVQDELSPDQVEEILALKTPPPLNLTAIETFTGYSVPADGLVPADIRYFGGKAANYGFLRRSIVEHTPVALGLSFNLWQEFLNQTLGSGMTLREEIDARLSGYTFPPANMQALADDLDVIREMFQDDDITHFTPAQEAAIIAILQDPQYGFDGNANIRFRSSTNVEDSAQFTGAGLYDSRSGCLADDLDGDTVGPSICDPSEEDERGVFRAIRRVFDSFYMTNAYLERLRHGVDEADVGMAMLVHHSFPDEIELANGVATYTKGPFSIEIVLVTQLGAVSVTEPEGGAIPEQVDVSVFGTSYFANLVTSSSLVLLGDTVMDFPDDYIELAQLLRAAADQFEEETGISGYVLDFEYKKLLPGGAAQPAGGLEIDQIRQIPQADDTPSIMPFLVNDPTDFIVLQGGVGTVFSNHRLKTQWTQHTRNMWLDPLVLATQTVLAHAAIEYNDGCGPAMLSGPLSGLPGFTHTYSGGANGTADSWNLVNLANPRAYTLGVPSIPPLVAPSQIPILTLRDLGFAGESALPLHVEYQQPVTSVLDFSTEPILVTEDDGWLIPRITNTVSDQLREHEIVADGVTINTSYYLHPPENSICAGCIFALSSWNQTSIAGITTEPIILTSDLAQSYDAGQHNFIEQFLFEPALDPGVTRRQLSELQEQGVRWIFAETGFTGPTVLLLAGDDDGCGCEIASCCDVDGNAVRDDACVWCGCGSGTCTPVNTVFADLGGAFGECASDGFANLFDRTHVLSCFAGTNLCDDLNIDAGGAFGNCAPDGFCNLFDVAHVLTAFAGINPCSCGAPQAGAATPAVDPTAGASPIEPRPAVAPPGPQH